MDYALILVGSWGFASAVLAVMAWRHRGGAPVGPSPEVSAVVAYAAVLAKRYGAARVSIGHLLLALAGGDAARARLAARGIDAGALLDALRGELPDATNDGAGQGIDEPTSRLFARASAKGHGTVRVDALLDETLAEPDLASMVNAARRSRSAFPSPPAGSADVVVHNDDKTTMDFVVTVLRGTFGKDELEALRLMLFTHYMGSARLGPYAREEAERLVAEATALARESGAPLRIEVAPHEEMAWGA